MSNDDKTRDIIHETADALRLLGNDYTSTSVECDPGDSAIRITKRNSEKTLYIIAYSNPPDTEIHLYEGPDSLETYHVFYDGTFTSLSPEKIAGLIIESF